MAFRSSQGSQAGACTTTMKRPAAAASALRRLATKRLNKAIASGAATKATFGAKKGKAAGAITAAKCRTLIAKLKNTTGIPNEVRNTVASRGQDLLGKRSCKLRVEQAEVVRILSALARDVEKALQQALQEATVAVKGAQCQKQEREAAQQAAEECVDALKQEIAKQKAEMKNSAKAVEASKKIIKATLAAQKQAGGEVKSAQSKKLQLEQASHDAYSHLKEASASGKDGQKRLGVIRKIGKVYGFHSEMMNAMPAVLKKEVDKRRTFDGLVMQYLDVEFERHVGAANHELEESERQQAEKLGAVEEARAALASAQEAQKKSTRALADAEKALVDGKGALHEAARKLKAYPGDMAKALRDLSLAKARIDKFQTASFLAQIHTAQDASSEGGSASSD